MALNQRGNPVYKVVERWIDAALRQDGSLFSPGEAIWSASVLEDVHRRFIDQPDEGDRSFHEKLRDQLAGANPSTYQLVAEALYLHLLPASNVTGDKKRQIIEQVLQWPDEMIAMPADLRAPLDGGLFSVGMAYHTFRPFQLQVILQFAEAWKELSEDRRQQLLDDPWAFKAFLFEIPVHGAQMQREALLHFVHPETFEDIVSQTMKTKIASHFVDLVKTASSDVDRRLLEIREALAERYGPDFSLYDEPILEQWNPTATKWGQFAYWVRRFYRPADYYETDESFDEIEIDYKLAVADRVRGVIEMIEGGDNEWPSALKTAFTKDTNLTAWQAHTPFLQWCADQPEEAAAAIMELWAGEGEMPARIRAFSDAWPRDEVPGRGGRLSIASVFALGIDAEEYPPYRADPFHAALKLLDLPAVSSGADEADEYSHFVAFLDQVRDALAERNIDLRHRLDAQALVWSVVKNGLPVACQDS